MGHLPGHIIQNYLKGSMEIGAFTGSLDAISLNNALRYTFFSVGIRELVHHVIDRLGPNENVIECEWWKDRPRKNDSTTAKRTEKMEYAIRAGLSDEFVTDVLKLDLSMIIKRTQQAVDDLSNYVHYTEKTFNISRASGNKLVEDTLLAVQKFLEVIDELKNTVSEALEESLYDAITTAAINDVLKDIDMLASHYVVDGNNIDKITIQSIDHQSINVQVEGSVDIEHQYGSDGDYARGDGVKLDASYPFTIDLELSVHDPLDIHIETDDLNIDTDDFYGDDYNVDPDQDKENNKPEDNRSVFDPTRYF